MDDEPAGLEPLDHNPARELETVILVGWSSELAARLTGLVEKVATKATVERTTRSSLRFSTTLPFGTLLILPDRLRYQSAFEYLAQLRANGIQAPAIVLCRDVEPTAPDDPRALGAFDLLPLDSFSQFAFERSLRVFSSANTRQRLLDEMSSRFRAYEQVLESKDDERLRVLQVAGALERRLTEVEKELETLTADGPVLSSPESGQPEMSAPEPDDPLADLLQDDDSAASTTEVRPPGMDDQGDQVQRLETELEEIREQRTHQELKLAELRKNAIVRERELRRLVAQSASVNDLATRLEASERIRSAQTREMLNQQQQIGELERKIESLAEVVNTEQGPESADPQELLGELKARLAYFERLREEQQVTINQLSRSLAVQQVDDALDNAHSRRNVLLRVEEAVRRSRRSDTPLTCLMVGIDDPRSVREEHGSVLYDYLLVQLAQRLQLALRHRDVLMRYGDEAFVLLTDADSEERAHPHAERLLKSACDEPLDLGPSRVKPSISVAILAFDPGMSGASELIRETLRLLANAQRHGNRQIAVGPSAEDEDGAVDEDGFVEVELELEEPGDQEPGDEEPGDESDLSFGLDEESFELDSSAL